MSEVLAAALGAIALVGIPFVAWFSRRATREARLLLRVEKLGTAYRLMPSSPEKTTFESHLTRAIADVNSWLDPESATRRRLVRKINRWTYGFGVLALFVTFPLINTTENPWQSSFLGAGIGVAIAIITTVASFLVERNARTKSALAAKERDKAAAALRMNALRRGEPMPVSQPSKGRKKLTEDSAE